MKTKLKPVIRYNRSKTDGLFESQYASNNVPFLCLPLTPTSRKAMVEAMRESISDKYTDSLIPYTMESLAEAALAALEGMAKTS